MWMFDECHRDISQSHPSIIYCYSMEVSLRVLELQSFNFFGNNFIMLGSKD